MKLGVLKESLDGERRVAITPKSIAKLKKLGFEVLVEAGAGVGAGIQDDTYTEAEAQVVSRGEALSAEIIAKVHPPTLDEVEELRPGALLISLLWPAQNEEIVEALANRGVQAMALDRVPRISRAQKMDVLSSMANIAGYRAVLEAAAIYGRFLGPQVTAAGTDPPAKILVIGAGVAGLAAIAAGNSMGAQVRAFDTRAATKEQVESLGGKFLLLEFEEDGEGQGGYAKVMSKAFIEAEMALFREQASEVDIIITTARVPGKKAPLLVPDDVLANLKPGSVVVDLAAEQGGNCSQSKAGEVVDYRGIRIVGYTDLESRMAPTASMFYSANVTHLLDDMVDKEAGFRMNLDDEVVRGATVVLDGSVLEPPPPPEPTPPKPKAEPAPVHKGSGSKEKAPKKPNYAGPIFALIAVALLFLVGRSAPPAFLQHLTVFVLACFVGWQVVWSVTAALHTPLMSVTNAISGIIIVGGMLQAGYAEVDTASVLGGLAIFVASINIFGGFAVTQRMLRMFRREG